MFNKKFKKKMFLSNNFWKMSVKQIKKIIIKQLLEKFSLNNFFFNFYLITIWENFIKQFFERFLSNFFEEFFDKNFDKINFRLKIFSFNKMRKD